MSTAFGLWRPARALTATTGRILAGAAACALIGSLAGALDAAARHAPRDAAEAVVVMARQPAAMPPGARASRAHDRIAADARWLRARTRGPVRPFRFVNAHTVRLAPREMRRLRRHPRVRGGHPVDGDLGSRVPAGAAAPGARSHRAHGWPPGGTWGQEAVGAHMLHAGGLDGTGLRIGVVDTGIDAAHAAFGGRVVAWRDFVHGGTRPYDDNGHGTAVASVAAGGRTAAAPLALGVAPAAGLVVAKAFDAHGTSAGDGHLRALEWMLDPDGDPDTDDAPHVIVNAWSTRSHAHPFLREVVRAMRERGIALVFAAGNDGPGEGTVRSPADYPEVITVGALDRPGRVAAFSARGPATAWAEGAPAPAKPDLVAPGHDVLHAVPGGGYGTSWGTSMAAPFVAGALALLAQRRPAAGSAAWRDELLGAAVPLDGAGPEAGAGALRLAHAPETPTPADAVGDARRVAIGARLVPLIGPVDRAYAVTPFPRAAVVPVVPIRAVARTPRAVRYRFVVNGRPQAVRARPMVARVRLTRRGRNVIQLHERVAGMRGWRRTRLGVVLLRPRAVAPDARRARRR